MLDLQVIFFNMDFVHLHITHKPFVFDLTSSLQLFDERLLLDITRQIWRQTAPQQIAIPSQFVSCPYELLVEHLLAHKLVCLGLYRISHEHNMPYVMANPPKRTLLHEKDRVFVLAPQSKLSVEAFLLPHTRTGPVADMNAPVSAFFDIFLSLFCDSCLSSILLSSSFYVSNVFLCLCIELYARIAEK